MLGEIREILERFEQAIGKPIGEISLAELQQFDRDELLAILAGPTNVLKTVFEGPLTDNNTASDASAVSDAAADLLLRDVQSVAAADSGATVNVHWEVTNIGDHPTYVDSTWRYFVYVSPDPTFMADRASLAATLDDSGEVIEPDGSRRVDIDVSLPRGIEGDWYFHVFANAALTRTGLYTGGWSASEFPNWPEYFQQHLWEGGRGASDPAKLNNRASSDAVDVTYREPDLTITDFAVTPPTADSAD